ncbi:unnamed protein product [Closterium sp. NIES-65]|nr:unnamed protein product [Closterium sp. NIES-65]
MCRILHRPTPSPLSIALLSVISKFPTLPPLPPSLSPTALALLNVKSALGVTFTSWLAASPCAIANSTIAVAGTWTGVLCSSAGDVLSVALTYLSVPLSFYLSSPPLPCCLIRYPLRSISMSLLACFLPACPPHMRAATEQASSTSTLPFLPTPAPAPCTLSPVHPLSDLSNNFLRGSLDKFVTFSGLKTLLQLSVLPPSPTAPSLPSPMPLRSTLLSNMLLDSGPQDMKRLSLPASHCQAAAFAVAAPFLPARPGPTHPDY